ncbi:MAG: sigma-70 family RNA polymerase sigma factor, partial [Bacteroidota bacterium]
MNSSYASLLARIRNGDSQALAEVMRDSATYCAKVLVKNTGCQYEEAQDYFIEAVLILRDKVLKGELTELSSLKAYLYRTCWNMWQEQNRRKARLQKHSQDIREQFYEESLLDDDPLVKAEVEKQSRAHYEQKLAATREALSLLDEKCRQILQLFYLQRMRMKANAEQMQFASADVAKTSKSRCYKKWMKE